MDRFVWRSIIELFSSSLSDNSIFHFIIWLYPGKIVPLKEAFCFWSSSVGGQYCHLLCPIFLVLIPDHTELIRPSTNNFMLKTIITCFRLYRQSMTDASFVFTIRLLCHPFGIKMEFKYKGAKICYGSE